MIPVRALIAALVLTLLAPVIIVRADSNVTVANKLTNNPVYIAPSAIAAGYATAADKHRLRHAVDQAGKSSVSVKVALLMQYPHNMKGPHDAANHLRTFIDFSGVLVLVSPHGIGVSSDYLTSAETARLERQAQPLCATAYADCAIKAIQASVPEVKAEVATANRNVAIFWAVAVAAFGVLIVVLVYAARRRQLKIIAEWGERDQAAQVPPPTESV